MANKSGRCVASGLHESTYCTGADDIEELCKGDEAKSLQAVSADSPNGSGCTYHVD